MNYPFNRPAKIRALILELRDEYDQDNRTILVMLTQEFLTKLNADEISQDVIALRHKHHGLWSATFEVNLCYVTPQTGTFDLLEPLIGTEKAEACETELLDQGWTVADLPAETSIAGAEEIFDSAHFHICPQSGDPENVTVEIHLTISKQDQKFPFVLATSTFPVSALTAPAAD